MPLNDKDFLQIDATIIAGLLILLTITSITSTDESPISISTEMAGNQSQTDNEQYQSNIFESPKFLAWAMIMPFAMSAIVVMFRSFAEETKRSQKTLDWLRSFNLGVLVSGFVYIIIFLFWIASL